MLHPATSSTVRPVHYKPKESWKSQNFHLQTLSLHPCWSQPTLVGTQDSRSSIGMTEYEAEPSLDTGRGPQTTPVEVEAPTQGRGSKHRWVAVKPRDSHAPCEQPHPTLLLCASP